MRILLIYFGNPYDPETGGQNRVYNLLSRLAKNNKISTIEPISNKDKKPSFNVENRYYFSDYSINSKNIGSFFSSINPSYYKSLIKSIMKFEPDIIHKVDPQGFLPLFLSKFFISSKIVYSAHNVESTHYSSIQMSSLDRVLKTNTIKVEETLATLTSDLVISVSEEDMKKFKSLYNIKNILHVPSGVEISDSSCQRSQLDTKLKYNIDTNKKVVGFHGTYNYHPNKEAVSIIQEEIAPTFNNQDYLFLIAGKGVPEISDENIISLGFVDDIHEFLSILDIAIVPIITGGGTNLKVFDYMGAKIPMILTETAAKGIDIENGREAIILDDISKFNSAIRYLGNSKSTSYRLGKNGNQKARNKYSWDKCAEDLEEKYQDLLSSRL